MAAKAVTITLRILVFRAGPQDFPYSVALTQAVVAITLVMAYLQYHFTLDPGPAAVHALASVGVLALFTRAVLQMRNVVNRLQQTINALFATGSALTLLSLAPLSALAPHMLRLQENPDLMGSEPLPPGPALAVMALSIWNFLVSANIYRYALDIRPVFGALVAFLSAVVTVTLSSAVTSLFVR